MKRLLSRTKLLILPCFLVLLYSSCKKNDVQVHVLDVITKEGVSGITFYYGEEEYVTNANGEFTIPSRIKVKNGEITTTLSQIGFVFEKAISACQPANSFVVFSGENKIFTRKLSYLKIISNWKDKENLYPNQYSLCFRVPNFNPTGSCSANSCFNYAGEFSARDDGIFVFNYLQSGSNSNLEIKKGENIAIKCRDNCQEISIDTMLIFATTYGDTTEIKLDIF